MDEKTPLCVPENNGSRIAPISLLTIRKPPTNLFPGTMALLTQEHFLIVLMTLMNEEKMSFLIDIES